MIIIITIKIKDTTTVPIFTTNNNYNLLLLFHYYFIVVVAVVVVLVVCEDTFSRGGHSNLNLFAFDFTRAIGKSHIISILLIVQFAK